MAVATAHAKQQEKDGGRKEGKREVVLKSASK